MSMPAAAGVAMSLLIPLSLALSLSLSFPGFKGLRVGLSVSEEQEGVSSGHAMTPSAVGGLHGGKPTGGGSSTDASLRAAVVWSE